MANFSFLSESFVSGEDAPFSNAESDWTKWAVFASSAAKQQTRARTSALNPASFDYFANSEAGEFVTGPSFYGAKTVVSSQLITPEIDLGPVFAAPSDSTRRWNFNNANNDDLVSRVTGSYSVRVINENRVRFTFAPPDANSRFLWAADFTSDGIADLVWANIVGGGYTLQPIQVAGNVPTVNVGAVTTATSGFFDRYHSGFGDFNGDGRTDFLRRDAGFGDGIFVGLTTAAGLAAAAATTATLLSSLNYTWMLAGVGDVNGDGRDDLIWRNVDNTVVAWLMNAAGTGFVGATLPSVGHEWRLETVNRLNSTDGTHDLLWRNAATGQLLGWLMNFTASVLSIGTTKNYGTFGSEDEFLSMLYSFTGIAPTVLWRRPDNSIFGTIFQPDGTLSSDYSALPPTREEAFFRPRPWEAFNFTVRSMVPGRDNLESTLTRTFGGMGVGGGNTARIPIMDAAGIVTFLYDSGGGLQQFQPFNSAGATFTVPRNMMLMGMGDFNSDGVGIDLVYRNLIGTGANLSVYTWNVATGRYNTETIVLMASLELFGQGSRMIGVGRVRESSGADEVVFQDSNGTVYIGGFVSTAGVLSTSSSGIQLRNQSSDWIGQGLADLNGDGRDDIVWRSATTGAISYWSTDLVNSRILTISPINTTPVTLEWDLVGMGDLDADGDDDLIWRRNSDGFTATWLMSGGTIGSVQGIATPGWDWRLEGTGDMNGDGRTDLIWRNASGQYASYLMNGAAITSTILSGTIDFNRLTMGWNQAFMRSL